MTEEVTSVVRILESKADLDLLISKNGDRPLIVKFFSPECEPCRIVSPWFYKFAREYRNGADFASINVDIDREIAKTFGVRFVPMFLAWINGVLIDLYPRDRIGDLQKTLDMCTMDRELVLKLANCLTTAGHPTSSSQQEDQWDKLDRDLEDAFAEMPKKRVKPSD